MNDFFVFLYNSNFHFFRKAKALYRGPEIPGPRGPRLPLRGLVCGCPIKEHKTLSSENRRGLWNEQRNHADRSPGSVPNKECTDSLRIPDPRSRPCSARFQHLSERIRGRFLGAEKWVLKTRCARIYHPFSPLTWLVTRNPSVRGRALHDLKPTTKAAMC